MALFRLPRIAELDGAASGWGFFLCAQKDLRPTKKGGTYLTLVLQDVSGAIAGKVFDDAERLATQFTKGDFVKVQGRGNLYNNQIELVIENIRRVDPAKDATDGFREEDCIPSAPRPLEDMWQELTARVASVRRPELRALLERILEVHGPKLRIWPAAVTVHHAYRGGLLEHVLNIIEVGTGLADAYRVDRDLIIAGGILHDLGKIEELTYEGAIGYSIEGNLVGHIAIGLGLLKDAAAAVPGFPAGLLLELEHIVLSHHGARDKGSPVVPMTIEAFLFAATDDLDAKMFQMRKHIAEDTSEGPFTAFSKRLDRVLLKPASSPDPTVPS
jgi:3'-5' exoribonuclease